MSRTNKGSKGPGYDYWSRRIFSGIWSPSKRPKSKGGISNKTMTRRVERHIAKRHVADELQLPRQGMGT